ncbi:endopeptidase La [Aliikangiella coralliicola]|uniref:Lon protease n=1 Tax=Aliikangiella coralliicola TaxID=2592383 RepID=A0A545UAX5_9GAMM|nr:endopeptidase La [Aliikangiella coralliicola]TQV86619.1 endopeptidase La [Aliikangiella coralliicola]
MPLTVESNQLPVLPLRDVVVFPHMVIPLFVGREKSIKALEFASDSSNQVLLVAQKDANKDEPGAKDVYLQGCIANILQMLRLPDGNLKVLVEGVSRASISELSEKEGLLVADFEPLDSIKPKLEEQGALSRSIKAMFENYIKLNKKIPSEVLNTVSAIDDAEKLSDIIAAHLVLKITEKQKVLEIVDVAKRLEYLMGLMESEIDLLHVERKIRGRVKKQMDKSQRDYYLNEQMKAIQKELGDEDSVSDIEELAAKVKSAGMPKEAREKAEAEVKKLKMMSPMSAEATVVRGYIDWMLNIPWKKRSKLDSDIEKAQKVLESDHYGLEEVKERILEFLAVQTRVKKLKGSVLCLVGPPGVGKTSLGESIARATGRQFVRMSLGGVRDEAEIRGHRRTYIGSMPGKILQKLSKVKVRNPLFLLDEIDKMAMDMRGDPASALLEVLDPEQNSTFNDHYLEVDYDLSEVMFVCTANSMNIPGPLLDRMEVINLSGYTEDEKLNIASRYLLPKQKKVNGLEESDIQISKSSLTNVVRFYTREAGVRNLEREISKICRKVVKQLMFEKNKSQIKVNTKNLNKYLGVEKFDFGKAGEKDQIGQVTGLAWTQVGGDLLTIEAAVTSGTGKAISTGHLGNVMQESIKAAMTVVRSRAKSLGIEEDFYQTKDIHVHVPEGATPKDGPSAGGAMCTALVSALTGIAVRRDVAMTGEITLRGEVLPIGGLKEKLLAAHRGGIKRVLIPEKNVRNLKEIPQNVIGDLEIISVKWIDEVLEKALVSMPTPISHNEDKETSSKKTAKSGKSQSQEVKPH